MQKHKNKIISIFIILAFSLLIAGQVRASVAEDFEYYQKYPLYSKYEKKQKYSKYKKYSKNKKKYGFASAKEKAAAKDAYNKYKLYKKDPKKYASYAQYAAGYKKYSSYQKNVSPYSKYSNYKKYKAYDKSQYDSYKSYGGSEYKAGDDRYVAFMNDLDNVTTNTGPEIRVGLWSYDSGDIQTQASAVNITADKIFKVTDCVSTTIGQIPVGENARVMYVDGSGKSDGSGGTLRVYNSNAVPVIPTRDLEEGKVCFEASNSDDNEDIIFDVDRPNSDYDRYRGKIKLQRSYTSDNVAIEGSARRVWVINTLPLEQYMWGFGEMWLGGVPEHAKAMVVAGRSYGRWHIAIEEGNKRWGEEGFDLLSTSNAQIYNGYDYEIAHSFISEAARETNGIIMKYNDEYVLGAFCSNTDGNTRAMTGFPYLVSVPDPYGKIDNPSSGNHMWGMSANGALALARDYDWSYTGILSYYYTDITIVKDY